MNTLPRYEKVWTEDILDESGGVKIKGGWKFAPVKDNGELDGFLKEVEVELEKNEEYVRRRDINNEYERRLAKATANWIGNGPVAEYLNKYKVDITEFPISADRLKELIVLVEFTDLLDFSSGKKVFLRMLESNLSAFEIGLNCGFFDKTDGNELETIIDDILTEFPDELARYRGGKVGLKSMFMGQIMKTTKGKVDPSLAQEVLTKKLDG